MPKHRSSQRTFPASQRPEANQARHAAGQLVGVASTLRRNAAGCLQLKAAACELERLAARLVEDWP